MNLNEMLFQYVQAVEEKIQTELADGSIREETARVLVSALIQLQIIGINLNREIEKFEYLPEERQ